MEVGVVMDEIAERLLQAVGPDRAAAGISIEGVYRPPRGTKVMPPSFPEGPYLYEPRWMDGEERRVVVLDQVPSQANRVEEALLAARDEGRIELPLFELLAKTSRGEVRLASLEWPHRYADAYLRDSQIDGTRFDRSAAGRRLREVSEQDVRSLYERDPGSLVFGTWDSHRKGRWPKFPRLYVAEMVGLDPREGVRRATRVDPLNLVGAIDDKAKAEGDWHYVPEGEQKQKKAKGERLSEIGHGHIAPSAPGKTPGGVAITQAQRGAWISMSGLTRLRFGDAPPQAARLARATLAALALASDRLAFDHPSVWWRPRSGVNGSGRRLLDDVTRQR